MFDVLFNHLGVDNDIIQDDETSFPLKLGKDEFQRALKRRGFVCKPE